MTTTNDNIQPFETIDERDLHAYVDGLLDDHRARKVEEYLKRHPEKAAEVRDYIEYNKQLRKAYEHEADEPVPQRLLSVLNRPVRNVWPVVGKAAAVVVLCALSAGGGWLGAYNNNSAVSTVSAEDGMVRSFLHQVALNAEPAFNVAPVEKLELNAGAQHTDPLNWLTQKVALEMQAPNLTQAGYTLEQRRLVTRGPQEFVELKYANSSGDAIKLYMKTRWDKEPPSIEFFRQGGKAIAHWQEGPLVYALTGALDQDNAAQIAELVRRAMTDVPDTPPRAQEVQILTPQPVQQAQQPQANYNSTQSVVPVAPLSPQKMNAVEGQY